MHQRFATVSGRIEIAAFDDAVDFQAQQWNVARVFTVGNRRKQADETLLTDGVAVVVKNLHADIIEMAAAMHR